MARPLWRWGLTLCLACSADPRQSKVAVPESTQSVLLISQTQSGLSVQALSDPLFRLELPDVRPVDLWVLSYQESLSDLGFELGTLPQDPAGRTLGRPDGIAHARATDEELSDWETPTELPTSLSALRVRGNPCLSLVTHRLEILSGAWHGYFSAARSFGDRAVVVFRSGPTLEISADAVTRTATVPDHAGAFIDGQGQLTLLQADGLTLRGSIGGPFTELGTLSLGGTLRQGDLVAMLDGPSDGSEVFALVQLAGESSVTSLLARLRDREWTTIHRAPAVVGLDLAWIGPDDVLAIGYDDKRLIEFNDGRVIEHDVGIEGVLSDELRMIELVPPFGLVAGSEAAQLWVRSEAKSPWRQLSHALSNTRAVTALAHDRSLYLAVANGGLIQYHPDFGVCPPNPTAGFDAGPVFSLGDELVMVEPRSRSGSLDIRVAWQGK
ncbi:MAG: hypothetical protein HY791_34960 [Deltaproteobacteria bacterium]|nr:hypothetical protein [Deltaproteobacteria bacterium]